MGNLDASLREIFADALEIADAADRVKFLDQACGADSAMRRRIEKLLEAHSKSGSFLRPAGDTTTTVMAEKVGDRIGRYRLLERIGRGGGGVVYLAQQEEPLRRRVALKILKLGMDTQSVVARFEAERQALALMDHPNIARVLDAGATETGRPYFVMELVAGRKLTEYCQEHRLSIRQRLELFIPVCQAVQHAHQKGIIHRDLKPSNILVSEQEGVAVPKVIDFGIAKAVEEGVDEKGGLTSVNQFLGTPAYMSPEQVEYGGRDIDTRSDIYSLGVILYELLTGYPPFNPKELATAGLEEMRRIIRQVEPPRPSVAIAQNLHPGRLPTLRASRERVAALRGELDWIVLKCLEKDRTRRYATANGLATELRRHLDDKPVEARPPTQLYRLQKIVRRHQLVFGAATAVALVLIAAVVVSTRLAWRARQAEHEQGRLREVAEAEASKAQQQLMRRYAAEGNRLLEEGRPGASLAWMVAALQLETGGTREADERLRIGQALEDAPRLLLHMPQGKVVNCVALSPDGRRLASGSDEGQVLVCDVDNGCELLTNLSLPAAVGSVQFSPEGTKVAAVDMTGRARIWDAGTGQALAPLLMTENFSASAAVPRDGALRPTASFSPDGKLLLLAWASKAAQLRDAATGQLVRELAQNDVVDHAAFSADGQWVVTCCRNGTARVWETQTGQPAGPPLQHRGIVSWAQFSTDGEKLLTVCRRHIVQVWDWRAGQPLAPEIPRRSRLYHASLSPDGKDVLTTAWSGYALLYDAASSRTRYSLHHEGGLVDAGFSPDGRHVATACEDGNTWIWEVGDASSSPLLLPEGNHIEQIAFNLDGRRLAVGCRGGHVRVWDLFPSERDVRRLPGYEVQCVAFEPSGRRALVLNTRPEQSISLYATDDGKLLRTCRLSESRIDRACFSPDGKQLLAFGDGRAVVVLDTNSGQEPFAPLLHPQPVREALWDNDGKRIFTAAGPNVRVWNADSGKLSATFSCSNPVTALALSPTGRRLASATATGVSVWDRDTGVQLGRLPISAGNIETLAFSPDGRWLATVGSRGTDGVVEVWDVAALKRSGRPIVHRDSVAAVQFSPNSRWLASACADHSARVWEALSGEPVSPWLPHSYETRKVSFSPDGERLVTQARRGEVRLWNARTGEPITQPILYTRKSGDGDVSFSPDGQRLLVCRGGDEAWLRELKPESAALDELKLLAEVVSCTRFDTTAGMVPLDEAELNAAWAKLRALRRKSQ